MKNNNIKLLVGLILGIATLFGSFAVATPASALTCNDATLWGDVYVYTPPAAAQFKYSTSYNTISNGGGTATPMQYFNSVGTFRIEQYISGLSESTTYYTQLYVDSVMQGPIRNFATPACQTTQNPTVNISANPSSIQSGQSSNLSWNSQNATSCSISGLGSVALTGNQNVSPASTTTYTITCNGASGTNPATASATVNVTQVQDPTVSITANPSSIQSGQSSNLSWNSQNATSCSISGLGSVALTGNQNVSPANTTTYNITCTNNVGRSANASATVNVTQVQQQQPTVTLYANPTSIQSGQNSNLTWNSTNATSCLPSWMFWNSPTSGSSQVSPASTTTYTITCNGASGTNPATASATVYVNQVQQQPTVTLYANPTSIQSGQNSNLTWNSTNATSCFAYWTSNTATSGSGLVVPTVTTNYSVTCTGATGLSATASATVYVNQVSNICQDINAINYGGTLPCRYQQNAQPTVTLYASPTNINSGQGSTLTWYSYNASYCSSTWNGSNATSGSTPVYPSYTTNYSITCYNSSGQSATDYATVNVSTYQQPVSYQPTVVLYADQTTVSYNGSANIRWLTTNATSCYASGGSVGWAGSKSIGPGLFYTGSLTGTRTYSITCSNSYGSATDTETIYVRGPVTSNPTIPTSLVLINSSIDRNQPIVPTIDNTRPRPGDEINYTVNYQNIGTGAITNLALRMNLPYEVDYMFSTPSNPVISGNTLVFNLGTLRANGKGTVTVRVRVRDNIPAGTSLNFPATLTYIDPSGQTQSVNANVSAEVYSEPTTKENTSIGANAFWAGFLPTNLFGWLLLIILILVLVLLAKYLFGKPDQTFSKKTTTTTVK